MRIRQIKPSWFTDRALQTSLRADDREFYVGLWMLADDDGWFEWDVDAIGVALYGFLAYNRRDARVARHAAALQTLTADSPHLILHPCGHAQVPKMPQHQRISREKLVTTDHRRHTEGKCPIPAASRGVPPLPAAPRPGTGTGKRNGTVLVNAREAQGTTEFRDKVGPIQ